MKPTFYYVSCNNSMTLLRTSETRVEDGYLYNIYSSSSFGASYREPKLHKKLKIYKQEPIGGYYVRAQGIRCYMNSLVEGKENTSDEYIVAF